MKQSVTYKTNRDPSGKWEVIAVYKTETEKGYEMFTGEILGRFDTRKQAREFIKARKAEDKVTPEEVVEQKKTPVSDDYWLGFEDGLKERIAKVDDERLLKALELAVSNRFKELGIVPRSLADRLVVPVGINDDMEMVKAVDTLKDMLRNRGITEMQDNCASEACKQVCKQMKAMEERTNMTYAHTEISVPRVPEHFTEKATKEARKQWIEGQKQELMQGYKTRSERTEDQIIMTAVKQAMEYSKQHTLPLQHQITELRNRIEVIANGQMSDFHAAVMPIIDDLKRSLDSYSDERIRAAVSADIGKVYNEINKVKKDTSAALKNSDLIADSLRRAPNVNSNSDIHFPQLRGLFKRIDMLEKKSVTEIRLSDNLTTFKRRTRHSIEDLEKRMTELHEAINELRAQHKPSFDIKPLEEGLANLQSQINKQIERSLETDMKYDKLDKAIRAVDDHYEHTCRLNSVEITHLKELMDGIGRWMTAILKTRFGRKLKIDDNN